MLTVAKRLHQLNFGALMSVYAESNRENGDEFYSHLSKEERLFQVEQDFYAYLSDVFFQVDGATYFLWEEEGRYVSALRLESYQDGLLLEALETHPEHRNMGYAKRLIQAVLETANYDKIYVHINRRNAPSIAVHTSCGFRKILDYGVYIDGSVNRYTDTYLFMK